MILVLDNYDSFTYNLVHLLGAHTDDIEVVRNDALTIEDVRAKAPDGILISPGPGRPDDAGISKEMIRRLGTTIPILGVCLGHQAIGEVFGGRVVQAPSLMHGKTSTIRHRGAGLFEGLPDGFTATRYHSLTVEPETLPEELDLTAWTDDDVIMGFRHRSHPIEGIQFHPESILTEVGPQLIANWIRYIENAQFEKERS